MTINEYQDAALRTANMSCLELRNVALGLTGESGEAADLIKKHFYHNHDLDKEHLAKELGDIAWYIAVGAYLLDLDLESVLQMNVDKLRERYPEGFDTERSLHRKADDV